MADDDTPDPRKLVKLATQTLSSAERRRKYRKIDFLDTAFWYPTQLAFFADGGSGKHQRLIYGGNQTGKTLCVCRRGGLAPNRRSIRDGGAASATRSQSAPGASAKADAGARRHSDTTRRRLR